MTARATMHARFAERTQRPALRLRVAGWLWVVFGLHLILGAVALPGHIPGPRSVVGVEAASLQPGGDDPDPGGVHDEAACVVCKALESPLLEAPAALALASWSYNTSPASSPDVRAPHASARPSRARSPPLA